MRRVAVVLAASALLAGCAPTSASPTPVAPSIVARAAAAGLQPCEVSTASPIEGIPGRWACLAGGEAEPARSGGRPVLLIFFAQWCAPCREEMPAIAAAVPTLSDVEVYLVNSGETNQELAVDLLAETGVRQVRVLHDPDWNLMTGMGAAHSLPRTLWVSPSGQVARHEGPWKSADDLRAWVEKNRSNR